MFTKNPSTFCLLYLHGAPIDASTVMAQPLLSLKISISPNRTRYNGLLWICVKSQAGASTRDISNHEEETHVPRIAEREQQPRTRRFRTRPSDRSSSHDPPLLNYR